MFKMFKCQIITIDLYQLKVSSYDTNNNFKILYKKYSPTTKCINYKYKKEYPKLL